MSGFVGRPSTDLAIQLLREGKVHECIECIDQFVTAYPDDALAYSILGAAYSQTGAHGMAIASFERSLAEEDSARARFNLGRAYEQAGRTRHALEQYTRAAEMDPDYKQAASALERLTAAIAETAAVDEGNQPPRLLGG
jgi:tetratricopeptide (TPR) repeat protein